MAKFFESYDLLLLPCTPVPPFDVNLRYPPVIDGQAVDNYIAGSLITSAITLSGSPALSLPAGFTRDGRPVGLQVVGRPYGEADLLAASALLEQQTGLAGLMPIDPRAGSVPSTA
jgi:amidase